MSLLFDNTVLSHVGEILEIKGVDIIVLVHQVLIFSTVFIKTVYLYPGVSFSIMHNHALLTLAFEVAHYIRLAAGSLHLLQNARLVGTIDQKGQNSVEALFIIGVDNVVFLNWLELQGLLAEAFAELLIRIVQVQEFLFDYLDVLGIFQVDLKVAFIVLLLLLLLLLLLTLG